MSTSTRGFASMTPEQRRQIARKGGLAISLNRDHMTAIAKLGGKASGESRKKKGGIL